MDPSPLSKNNRKTLIANLRLNAAGFGSICLALGIGSLMAGHASPAVAGGYAYVMALVGIGMIAGMPGLQNAIAGAAARNEKEGCRAALRASFLSSLAGSALLALSAALPVETGPDARTAILIAAACLPFYGASQWYYGWRIGKEDIRGATRLWAAGTAGTVAAQAAALLWAPSVSALTAASLLPHILIEGWASKKLYDRLPKRNSGEKASPMRFGVAITAADALASLAFYADTLVMTWHGNMAAVATYAFAKLIPENAKEAVKNAGLASFNAMATATPEELVARFPKFSMNVIWCLFGGVCAYMLAAPGIFRIFFPKYMEAVPYSQVLALSAMGFGNHPAYKLFQARKYTEGIIRLQAASAGMQITAAIMLIPAYGIWGAVIGRTISRIGSLLYSMRLARKFIAQAKNRI